MLVLALTDEATAEEDTCKETGAVDAEASDVADVSRAETTGRAEGVITDVLVLDDTVGTADASELAEDAGASGRPDGVMMDALVLLEGAPEATEELSLSAEETEEADGTGRPEGVMMAVLVLEATLEKIAVLSALADEAEGTGRPEGVMMTVLEDAAEPTEESTELTDEAENTGRPEADVTAVLTVEVDAGEAIEEGTEEAGAPELFDCSLVLVVALEATSETVETITWLLL